MIPTIEDVKAWRVANVDTKTYNVKSYDVSDLNCSAVSKEELETVKKSYSAFGMSSDDLMKALVQCSYTVNAALRPKLPYDPLKDLVPVALVSSSPIVMAAPINSPFKSYADVVAAAKGKPDALTLGYSGNGTVAHLAGELAENAADIKLRHIPYKGAAQAMTDLVGGQIDLYMSSVPTLLGQVRNGKLKVIAITSAKRSPQLPDVPTLAESGYKGFEAVTWFGILAPAGTPAPIVAQLNKTINAALQQPDVADKLRSEGGDVLGGTAEQFGQLLKSEVPRWAKIVKDSGASLD